MDYHRYVCRHNSHTAKEVATRITNIFNNAYVKTSSTQQPDRFASLLHLSGTCNRMADLAKVQSVLGLTKVSFSSEFCLPSLGTSVTLCDLMKRHAVHAELSSLQLTFERQLTRSCVKGSGRIASSSCLVSLSLVHQRFRPGEPLRLQLCVKTLHGTGREYNEDLLACVQEGFDALKVPFTIGRVTEVTSRRALVPIGSTFAPCTRIVTNNNGNNGSSMEEEEGFVHLQPLEAIVFSDEKERRQAVVELRWAEQGASEALLFMKRAAAVWLEGCDRAKYLITGDYSFVLDLLKPLDRTSPPSLKQLVAKRVLDKTPLSMIPSTTTCIASSTTSTCSTFGHPHHHLSSRAIAALDGLIPRELMDYTTQREEVVLLGSSMHFSFECSEQQAKDRSLPAHAVLPFLEYCASMTLRPQPRTLSCDYLDLAKKDDGTFEISARAFKAAIGNADNFYGEALRTDSL